MLNKEERFSFIFLWEKETKTKIIFRVERKELADFLEVDERYPYHGDENPANLWAFSEDIPVFLGDKRPFIPEIESSSQPRLF